MHARLNLGDRDCDNCTGKHHTMLGVWSFGHIDVVRIRASNVDTSKRTHTAALNYTHAFYMTYSKGEGVQMKRKSLFVMKTRRKIVLVIKMRHAKAV